MNTTMREITERLKTLQALDAEIQKLQKEEDRWPAILALRDREIAVKAAELERQDERHKKTRVDIRGKETELKSIEEAIVKLNVTLNTVKTNKEYTAILNEIATRKDDISRIEEDILSLMEKAEARQRDVEAARAVVDAARDEKGKLETQAKTEREEIAQERGELDEKRNALAAELPPDILEQYERIAKGRDGVAVVAVTDGVCQGCFIALTAQEINLLMGADNLIRCKSCSRILYLES